MGDLFRALRPHRWGKNVLLRLPLLAAHRFDGGTLLLALLGMLASLHSLRVIVGSSGW